MRYVYRLVQESVQCSVRCMASMQVLFSSSSALSVFILPALVHVLMLWLEKLGIPFIQNRLRGPKWLPFIVGVRLVELLLPTFTFMSLSRNCGHLQLIRLSLWYSDAWSLLADIIICCLVLYLAASSFTALFWCQCCIWRYSYLTF